VAPITIDEYPIEFHGMATGMSEWVIRARAVACADRLTHLDTSPIICRSITFPGRRKCSSIRTTGNRTVPSFAPQHAGERSSGSKISTSWQVRN
jgi:hypothetical protein